MNSVKFVNDFNYVDYFSFNLFQLAYKNRKLFNSQRKLLKKIAIFLRFLAENEKNRC